MPISWLTVLQAVPWGEGISNAPKVAAGAKKLWGNVSGKPGDTPPVQPQGAGSPMSPADMQARLQAAEAAVAQLHEQMRACSEIIQALAEQNTQLIARVETHRRRVKWLSLAVLLASVVAGVGLLLILRP